MPVVRRAETATTIFLMFGWWGHFMIIKRLTGWQNVQMVKAFVLGAASVVAAIAVDAVRPKRTKDITLYLRKQKQSGGEMLAGHDVKNMWLKSFDTYFLATTDIVDLAVMKYVDTDCPHLTKQEEWHAKMHREGQKAVPMRPKDFFAVKCLDFMLLRCGDMWGRAFAGAFEAGMSVFFHGTLVLPFVRGYANDLALFHMFEEMEHSELTVHILRAKTTVLVRALVFPFVAEGLLLLGIMMPPLRFVEALGDGTALGLLQARALTDLGRVYLAFFPSAVAAVATIMWTWVLPFPESDVCVTRRYELGKSLVAKRGIDFDVVDQGNYTIVR
jgi:hypothetical protein